MDIKHHVYLLTQCVLDCVWLFGMLYSQQHSTMSSPASLWPNATEGGFRRKVALHLKAGSTGWQSTEVGTALSETWGGWYSGQDIEVWVPLFQRSEEGGAGGKTLKFEYRSFRDVRRVVQWARHWSFGKLMSQLLWLNSLRSALELIPTDQGDVKEEL